MSDRVKLIKPIWILTRQWFIEGLFNLFLNTFNLWLISSWYKVHFCHSPQIHFHSWINFFVFKTGKMYFHGISIDFIVAGRWTNWSPWRQCSVTCGGGKKERSRSCTDPAPTHGGAACSGEATEKQDCFTSSCAGENHSQI